MPERDIGSLGAMGKGAGGGDVGASKTIKNVNVNIKIDLIGYHGQTIFHDASEKISKQIGDGELLSQLIKKKVIYTIKEINDKELFITKANIRKLKLYHNIAPKISFSKIIDLLELINNNERFDFFNEMTLINNNNIIELKLSYTNLGNSVEE